MFPFNSFPLNKLSSFDLVQLLSVLSLNYYFKKKSPKLNSIIDQFFNYFVLAFAGNLLVGKKHINWGIC